MKRFLKRLRALWRRRQLDRDLEEEIAFHLAMQVEEGAAPSVAQRQFGSAAALKESCRELWMFTPLETWWQDLRYAVRTLGKSPTVTWVAIAALALGIGANTTMFTVISSALSFNMGVDHIERLVIVTPGGGLQRSQFRQVFPEFADLRTRIKSITHLAAYRMTLVNVSDSGALPDVYSSVQMTASGWAVINRKPVLGRVFTAEDERPDASLGLLLSHRVWRNRYGEDPAILGKVVRVNEVPRIVIGVMPSGSQFPEDADMWTLLTPRDLLPGLGQFNAMTFGRLADGVTLMAARSEMDAVARSLTAEYPERFPGLIVELRPFLEIIGIYAGRVILLAVLCAVTFVLLIVCADVANLLLARAAARAREISVRIAIGAGRARIIRQLLVEITLLAIGGGFGGWLVALAGLRWFDHLTSNARRPSWIDFSMNTRAFVYLAAISIGAGILFGLAPALQLAKVDVNRGLKEGGRGTDGGMRGRLSSLLVVFQMALCVVLLAGAGLMIHSSVKLYNAPIALNPANVLTMRISLPAPKYPSSQDRLGFYRRLKAKLAPLPGVQVVSLTSNPPLTGSMTFRGELEGAAASDPNHAPPFGALLVDADYFRTLQIRLRRGRLFTEQDELTGSGVVIVNESFAAKYWPGQDPLGRRLRKVSAPGPQPWLTVVGLAPDNPQNFQHPLERDPLIYLPYTAQPQDAAFIMARTAVPPDTLSQAFRRALQSLDENLPAQDMSSLDDRIAKQRLNITAFGMLFTIFAAIALLLACIGLYAVIAHSVSRRTQEIGIRMAMGAPRDNIVGLVLAQGMRQVAIGLAVGLPLAFGVTHVLRGVLEGVSPGDPWTFAGVVAVLLLAGLLGCAIPAGRAVHVDPLVVLRSE